MPGLMLGQLHNHMSMMKNGSFVQYISAKSLSSKNTSPIAMIAWLLTLVNVQNNSYVHVMTDKVFKRLK